MIISSINNSCLSLISFWMIQLLSSGEMASVISQQGCTLHYVAPAKPSPIVDFSETLVISNLLLHKGDVIKLQIHLKDDNEKQVTDVFVNEFDKLVMKEMQGDYELLAISRQPLPPAPRALYWQHLVINHTSPNTIQAYNLDDKENTVVSGYLPKTTKVVINSMKNITVALDCVNIPSVLTDDSANEMIQENILHWRESIAWLLLLLSIICIIFLSVALCMRHQTLTSMQRIVPSFTKFLKRTSSHHQKTPSAEMKFDVNVQIKREPEEVTDPSEISAAEKYVEEIQPPSYIAQASQATLGPCESSSIPIMDDCHNSNSSASLSHTTDISHVSESSLHRSHATEQSYLPFDSSYESQNIQSTHSQTISNGTLTHLSNGLK